MLCHTPFVNEPLLSLKQLSIYKCWLVHFPIDADCHQVIKQFLCKICMTRQFTYPSSEEVYKGMVFTTIDNKNSVIYINEQGIVFKRREHYRGTIMRNTPIGRYTESHLYTNDSYKHLKNILVKGIDALTIIYSKESFVIDLPSSGISEISIDGFIYSFSPKAHQLINYHITVL